MGRDRRKAQKSCPEMSCKDGNPRNGKSYWRGNRQARYSPAKANSNFGTASCSKSSYNQSTSDSVCKNASPDDNVSDIPGFYYDKEKKTYFKILPNTMSSVSSFVTKESIKRKESEKDRLLNIKNLPAQQSLVLQRALFPLSRGSGGNGVQSRNLHEALKTFQCGLVTCENFRTLMDRHRLITLQPDVEVTCSVPGQTSLQLENLHEMLATHKRDYLACVWSLKSSVAQCIQLIAVSKNLKRPHDRQDSEKKPATSKKSPAIIKPILTTEPAYKKISNICWASFPGVTSQHTVLYTASCPIGYSPTIVYACNFNTSENCVARIFELNLGLSTVWSCAWHNFKAQFSIGSERKCLLIDVATRKTWTYHTHNSDSLAQTFSTTDPHRLYSGTRGGSIITYDTRCPGRRSQQHLQQKHGIGCLRLLQDENYLMAGDFSGDIVKWDQRMKKIVMRYEGLKNSHYQLPFYLDESESFVCGGGSDSYSKLWDVRTGSLLQSLPPPLPASSQSFPQVMYSQRWGDTGGNSGLLIGTKNIFKLYC